MTNESGGPRRTQEQRRTETVTKLLESTLEAIAELGYAGATTREICDRAGVSQGGLFRHFATRRELVVAALDHLYESGRPAIRKLFEPDLGGYSPDRVADQLKAARGLLRQDRAMAFLEVVLAARTEPDLRADLAPLLARHERAIRRIAARNPVFARLSDESQHVWLDCVYQMLWADALWTSAHDDDALDDPKIDAVVRLGFLLAEREGVATPA